MPIEPNAYQNLLFMGIGMLLFAFYLVVSSMVRGGKSFREAIVGLSGKYPTVKDAFQMKELDDKLTELRVKTGCDRSYVLLFKNGDEFLPNNSVWKTTCLRETKQDGVSYEMPNRRDVLVSTIHSIVDPLITGAPECSGVKMAEPCGECKLSPPCKRGEKRIVVVQTGEMPAIYEKYLLEKQGVRTLIQAALMKRGNVFGVVCMDFCVRSLHPNDSDYVTCCNHICRMAEKLQCVLQFKKVPAELIRG